MHGTQRVLTRDKTGSIRSYAPGSNKDGAGLSPSGVSLEPEHGTRMWMGAVHLGVFAGSLLCNEEGGREEEKPTEGVVPRMLYHGQVRPSPNKGPCDPEET